MKHLLLIISILLLSTPLFGQSERPETIIIPVSSMGDVSDTRKQILQNTLEDELKTHFRLVPQQRFEQLKDKKCDYLVEEKGYVVGVINKVVLGVVQVDRWERIKEGEHEGRVEFFGKLLSDHPSIEYSLKERTVSGPIQGFNFPDQDEKES